MHQVKSMSATMSIAAFAMLSGTAASAETSVFIQMAPPAPRHEVVPPLQRGQVWVPGHWQWQGNGHTWVNGHHLRARQGYHYQQPRWVQQGDRWAYNRGAWAHGDGDHDGIANRHDRDRDNDGIRNRNDRDRDGDGVRNRHDRRPDNPNRR